VAQVGRPSLLTPEVRSRFVESIKAGAHYDVACEYAGISYKTFRDWMQRGLGTHSSRKSSREYVEFAEEVTRAEAHGEIAAIVAIRAACKEDWRAAAWMLERRHSQRWANNQRIELQVMERTTQELNLLFETIASDPEMPIEAKQKIFAAVASLQERSAVAPGN
jgi:hypothetical protein